MRKKTIQKIKKIVNEVIGHKYGGNRVAMPYYNAEHGDITGEDLGGSPADSNSFMSYMVLHYYEKEHIDDEFSSIETRLESVEDDIVLLYNRVEEHVTDLDIHVTSQDKTSGNTNVQTTNTHVADSDIHVTSQDKTSGNGKSTVTVSTDPVSGANTVYSMNVNGTPHNFPTGGNIPIITTAPTSDITDGNLHVVCLDSEPQTKYNGYLYFISEE